MSRNNLIKKRKYFKFSTIITQILLMIEYVLGVIVAMRVKIPSNLPNGDAMGWVMKNSPITVVHIVIATFLLITAILTIVYAVSSKNTLGMIASIIGLIMILGAWQGGTTFVQNGQNDSFSLMMRVSFILALAAYTVNGYLTNRFRD